MTEQVALTLDEADALAERVCRGAGASARMARVLAQATVSAELHGKAVVGFAHLVDYLEALRAGRIDGAAEPRFSSPAPALIACDVGGGIAQLGFDDAFVDFAARAKTYGIALFAARESYTAGELGWYVRRLVERGLIGLAAANGPALMQPPGASGKVYCTNPIAFGAPGVVIDQSSSHAAFVAIREAAARGEAIPDGWAVDAAGRPTTDPARALGGALLTFGGARGANLALMVEVLAAGVSGANWSLDAPAFDAGAKGPGAGLTVIAIAPALLAPDFAERLEAQIGRLSEKRVYVPGRAARKEEVWLAAELVALLESYAT